MINILNKKAFLLVGLLAANVVISSQIKKENVENYIVHKTQYKNVELENASLYSLYFYKFKADLNEKKVEGYILPGLEVMVSESNQTKKMKI